MVAEKVFAVIAETTRRDILAALAQESKAVGQLVDELGVSQPTVSKHLRVMREAGVVTMRAQGQKRFYGINAEPLTLVSTWLESLGAGAAVSSPVPPATPQAATPALVEARAASTERQPVRRQSANAASTTVDTVNGTSTRNATPATAGAEVSATAPAHVPVAAAQPAPIASAKPEFKPTSVAAAEASTPTGGGRMSKDTAVIVLASSAHGQESEVDVQLNGLPAIVVQSNDHDGGVPGQISRSVGRAANKAADLLSNLPTFRRRKD